MIKKIGGVSFLKIKNKVKRPDDHADRGYLIFENRKQGREDQEDQKIEDILF